MNLKDFVIRICGEKSNELFVMTVIHKKIINFNEFPMNFSKTDDIDCVIWTVNR